MNKLFRFWIVSALFITYIMLTGKRIKNSLLKCLKPQFE